MAEQEENDEKKMGIDVAGGADPLTEKASMMRKSLQKFQTTTDDIVTIVDSVGNHLSRLELSLRPTQERIDSIRICYENIDKTLAAMEIMKAPLDRSCQEVSPPLSHSIEPLDGSGSLTVTDIPPISPSDEFHDVKILNSNNSIFPLFNGGRATSAVTGRATPCSGQKTIGGWLKDRGEEKKGENGIHNAQLQAAVSVAELAVTVAAMMAEKAASSADSKDEKAAMAVVSAANLFAARCVEAAEAMGAKRGNLSSVKVHSPNDITNLRAAAATALPGATTPLESRKGIGIYDKGSCSTSTTTDSGEIITPRLLARGLKLLKRTRKGDLHWKKVSVDIDEKERVMLKMKSKHVGGIYTKNKKYVVLGVCTNLPAWPGRHLVDDGKERWYFGLETESPRGTVEFECTSQREHDVWTQWVSRLLSMVAEDNTEMGLNSPSDT